MSQMRNTGHYDPADSPLFIEREKTQGCDQWCLFDVRVCIKLRLWVGSPFNHRGPEETQLWRTSVLHADYL